jgi:aminodeoxyfutalosine deaminase
MRKITADLILPISLKPIRNGVIILDDAGKILKLDDRRKYADDELENYEGVIVPGFVNAHCHLELSHLKGAIDTGKGLIAFITDIVTKRGASATQIAEAVAAAEAEMLANGIVAVGDISNTTDTFAQKAAGNLRYHTFVECFDLFREANAAAEFERFKAVYEALQPPAGSRKSLVPHAPYSVSPTLFRHINGSNTTATTVSIHNQELAAENELFEQKTGGFISFFKNFGTDPDIVPQTGETAIRYALQHLDPTHRTLFVHNTMTAAADIAAAAQWGGEQVFWVTCPNANLYIENRLPDYRLFLDAEATVCVGTDSLSSNWQLSVLDELKTITKFQSYIPLEVLIRWATLNGATALGFEDTLGSIEVGKTPGLNLLNIGNDLKLRQDTVVRRLV